MKKFHSKEQLSVFTFICFPRYLVFKTSGTLDGKLPFMSVGTLEPAAVHVFE